MTNETIIMYGEAITVYAKESASKTKEGVEKMMNNNVVAGVWSAMKKASRKVSAFAVKAAKHTGGFLKKHGPRMAGGFGALTVGGMVTPGLTSAVLAGSAIYAGVRLAAYYIKARKQEAMTMKVLVDEFFTGLIQSALYVGVSGVFALLGAGVVAGILNTIFKGLVGAAQAYNFFAFTVIA